MMEPEERKISVWVCQEEKVVLGLSKRTTCADVVQVLLEQQQLGGSQSFCIVEKWRGYERVLPNHTKILRLWVAWGEQQSRVKFVLVRSEAALAKRGARSAEARVVLSKPRVPTGAPMGAVSSEKQRRVVWKAFRKLEKINRKRAQTAHRDVEKMETLVHVVISQDHTIRQQIHRIGELDAEIEQCEAKVHFDRIQSYGRNYVQDTYLLDAAAAAAAAAAASCGDALPDPQQEDHERRGEELLRLQQQLREHEALIDSVTAQIEEELNQRWMRRRTAELQRGAAASAAEPEKQQQLLEEEDRVRTELDASLYIGLRLSADLEAIRSDLELTQEICTAREEEMRDLLEKVNTLDIQEGAAGEGGCDRGGADVKTGMMSILDSQSEWVEQARGLSKAHRGADDDSDTGLSSLHSQESENQPVWESLV